MGIAQYFSNIIYFSIGGVSGKESIKYFIIANIILIALYIMLMDYLIISQIITHIRSVAILTVFVWVIRDIIGIYLITKRKNYG